MTDLLLSPWPYGYALIVLGLVLSYVWLCAAAAVHGLNDHFDWHVQQQESKFCACGRRIKTAGETACYKHRGQV